MDNTNTEQVILETAERLFLERGFALTSTTDIAREAGCNQALINYYFRTKEKLFASIFEKKLELFFASISGYLEKDLPFRDKIRTISERHYAMLRQNPRIPFLVITELGVNINRITDLKSAISRTVGAFLPQLEKELEGEIAAGRVRRTSILEILLTLVSLNIGAFLLHPILELSVLPGGGGMEDLLERRGGENARILLASLEPGAPA